MHYSERQQFEAHAVIKFHENPQLPNHVEQQLPLIKRSKINDS